MGIHLYMYLSEVYKYNPHCRCIMTSPRARRTETRERSRPGEMGQVWEMLKDTGGFLQISSRAFRCTNSHALALKGR